MNFKRSILLIFILLLSMTFHVTAGNRKVGKLGNSWYPFKK
ncbi:Type-F conjugative transfer system pilin assembly protein TrbC [Caenorhabditis elegans]|uniref:Type-F conjugative transfer system pilin assembly protein TrbC n=1 Tax=Caenorhabditis elegans TaxID=6239 RepID=D3DEM5_CAEEL|nr:Type-F conjugative transfer system pilin assembly protein TrbC [Caenorhabditis elegans]CBJ25111.1 Type-F conjugative transfer system pilin assembly protein TrbC [Caenorhabditis elegans]|eukprot:NP_001255897.1 Uncharacterized protein CELE_Y51H4A.937 [Caenorhabditis elegans]